MSKDNFQKLNHLIKQFYKELRSPDFSLLMRIRRIKVNPCRVLFTQKYICSNYVLTFGKNKYLK